MTKEHLLKKRMTIMIVALLIVFGGIIGWNILKSIMIKRFFATFELPAVTVSSVTAKKANWYPTLNAVGNFVAINGVDVNAQTSGNIVKINFKSGEMVTEDQSLLDIDDRVLQAQLKFNQAELVLKELNYKRQEDLYKRGATPSSSLDEAKANLSQAQANVEKIQAEIKQKHITAPFTGRLGIRLVNLGQYVTPGETAIVSLQSLDPLFIEFYLPEQHLQDVRTGQTIYLTVEDYPDMLFKGSISAINSKVDPTTHNIKLQGTIPNCPIQALANPEDSKLITVEKIEGSNKRIIICNSELNAKEKITNLAFIPGIFADIDIELPPVPDQIILPATAISYSLYGNSVFLIEEDSSKSKDTKGQPKLRVKRVFVKTGAQQGTMIQVKEGLKEGQTVVSSGEIKLQNGTAVVINNSVQLPATNNIDSIGQ